MEVELFYKRDAFSRKSSLIRGLDDKCREFSASKAENNLGWIVSFEYWTEPTDERSPIYGCKIWTKRHEVRVFRTLENVAKQLLQSGITSFVVKL